MAPRKRKQTNGHVDKNKPDGDSKATQKKAKAGQSQRAGRLSPTITAFMLIAMVLMSAGIYMYFFGGISVLSRTSKGGSPDQSHQQTETNAKPSQDGVPESKPTAQEEAKPTEPKQAKPTEPKSDEPEQAMPNEPKQAMPSEPEQETHTESKEAKSTEPEEAKPTEPEEAKPTEPEEAKPTEPEQVQPTEPQQVKPTEPEQVKPAEPEEAKHTEPEQAQPTETEKVKPTEPEKVKPTETEQVQPTEPEKVKPTEPVQEKPTEPEQVQPTEPEQVQPTEPEKVKPTEPEKVKPTEPEKPKPIEPKQAKPTEPEQAKSTESTESKETKRETKPTEQKETKGETDSEEVKPIKKDTEPEAVKTDTKPSEQKQTKEKKPVYAKASITNKEDNKIRKELDAADKLLEQGKASRALDQYEKILKKYPKSPRASLGKAHALDKMSEQQRSNPLLERSIEAYVHVLDLEQAPDEVLLTAGRRAADRQTFRGWGFKAARTTMRLIDLFPDEIHLWNELGVQYLMVGRIEDARNAFREVLKRDNKNGFGKAHLGFIKKTSDNDPEGGIPLLQQGIDSEAPGVTDGRFYFHLGDAYYRTGRHDEAYDVYKKGAEKGLFLSYWQRSLYNVDTLTGRPWWTTKETTYEKHIKLLEDNWEAIRDEGLAQLNEKKGSFIPEEENLRETGDWRQFTLYQQGRKVDANCKKAPKTCSLIDSIVPAKSCSRGQVKFSVMQPGVHVWPHCGPTNCRIRSHLGLVVPKGLRIRVANDTRTWKEGKLIVFDDSFEHEVWHEGDSFRLVLIVDFWHPELTEEQRRTLPPI